MERILLEKLIASLSSLIIFAQKFNFVSSIEVIFPTVFSPYNHIISCVVYIYQPRVI